MKKLKVLLSLLLMLTLILGCSPKGLNFAAPTVRPVPDVEPSQAPDVEETPHSAAVYKTKYVSEFFKALCIDETIEDAVYSSSYSAVSANVKHYITTIKLLEADLLRAAYEAADALRAFSDEKIWLSMQFDMPDWKYFAAYLYTGDIYRLGRTRSSITLEKAITAICELNIAEHGIDIEIRTNFCEYSDLIESLQSADDEHVIDGRLTYAYLRTVYDDNGDEKEFVQPEPEGNLLKPLTIPVDLKRMRDTWYAARDSGDRKHTGIDIIVKADTPILSCTDGRVLRVDYGSKSGNYVVIRDEFGYDFHYMHMIRLSTFLHEGENIKAGDVIGHVGNTGNSDTNHLHLSIISPDYLYIDPYPYLLNAQAVETETPLRD